MEKTRSYFEFDYDSYRQELIEALNDPKTHFYLDTCFLNKLLFLRSDVRSLILDWLKTRIDHVHVPYWVYMEYMKRAVNAENLRAISPWSNFKYKSALEQYKKNLYLYLDDKVAKSKFNDVVECRKKFDEAVSTIGKIERLMSDFSIPHNEISKMLFPTCVMKKIENLQNLERDFNIRCENKIPPGFDETKETNKYGDFFIWNEILASHEKNQKAVFCQMMKKEIGCTLRKKLFWKPKLWLMKKNLAKRIFSYLFMLYLRNFVWNFCKKQKQITFLWLLQPL